MRTTIVSGLVVVFLAVGASSAQVFEEDFSDPFDPEWLFFDSPNGRARIENGTMHFDPYSWEYPATTWTGVSAANFIYEFDYRQDVYDGWFYVFHSISDPTVSPWDSPKSYVIEMDGRGFITTSGRREFPSGGSTWFEPWSENKNGLFGTGSDSRWHRMRITKQGPEIIVEIVDTGYRSYRFDCEPHPAGFIGYSNSGYHKHTYFDNIRFEVLDIPRESWDANLDGIADACEDADGDAVENGIDNCPDTFNSDQSDLDGDEVGDVCDPYPNDPTNNDIDLDGIDDDVDNCLGLQNADQADIDGDSVGDACDNCPSTYNADQNDIDADGAGDACDPFPDRADNYAACLEERSTCLDDLDLAEADLDACTGDLDVCTTDLNTCTTDLDLCSGDLETCETDLSTCTVERDGLQADLDFCRGDLSTCETNLGTCQNDLGTAQQAIAEGHDGLAEIRRLLSLPFGQRSTTFTCSAALCPDLQAVIDMLLDPAGQNFKKEN